METKIKTEDKQQTIASREEKKEGKKRKMKNLQVEN